MKLYMHPVSNASRPVRLYIHQKKIEVEEKVVDLMKGEHLAAEYAAINPSKLVPVLDDGDFRLTESATILRYLAAKYGHPEYPTDLRERSKVDELLDWFNTQFYRDFGYGLAYPQIFPNHKRPNDEQHQGVIAWGQSRARTWFEVLDQHWLSGGRAFLRGDQITIADYFGGSLVTIGECIRCDFSQYPNVDRWITNLKELSAWNDVNQAMYGFRDYLAANQFEAL